MTFSGKLDPYYSDILVEGDKPAWVGTVGYNNNSANIQLSSGVPKVSGHGMLPMAFLVLLAVCMALV